MNAVEYKQIRRTIGTQTELAQILGVDQKTISNRESGKTRITREAEIAINEVAQYVKRMD